MEYRKSTFRTDRDVAASLGLPVLAVVPAIGAGTQRARRPRQWLMAVVLVAILLACAGLAWVLLR